MFKRRVSGPIFTAPTGTAVIYFRAAQDELFLHEIINLSIFLYGVSNGGRTYNFHHQT